MRSHDLNFNPSAITRDLKFFILAYSIGIITTFLPNIKMLRCLIALGLVLMYPLYVYQTFSHYGETGKEPEQLYFSRILSRDSNHLGLIFLQLLLGVSGILYGAYLFVDHIQSLALSAGVSPLLLSLIISPIATELPEKANSVLWARNGKDTLALGNISGSLVFQSCFPVAFGVGCTPWNLEPRTIAVGIISLACAGTYLLLIKKNALQSKFLMCGGLVYALVVTTLVLTNRS
jgi:cation:H+ antiporter